jgi:arabinose-5-phosphate isomerase
MNNNPNVINIAKEVFEIEANEIKKLSHSLSQDFEDAVNAIYNSKGKLIVSGMGKSGIIGKKIAATCASTGTPSFFLHAAEAYHGDLGMIEKNDVVLLISNSGETDEILKLIPFLTSQGNCTISMSSNPNSTLAKNTNYHLNIYVDKEACPLRLAPTSSTTVTLVMGDAIAVSLMMLNNFQNSSFAKFHPGGSLGRRLLTTVDSIMIQDNLPVCGKDDSIKNVIHKITEGKCGLVMVHDNNDMIGVITDGDISRFMDTHEEHFFKLSTTDLMTKSPITIRFDEPITHANDLMTSNEIGALIVVDENEAVVGIIDSHQIQNS